MVEKTVMSQAHIAASGAASVAGQSPYAGI